MAYRKRTQWVVSVPMRHGRHVKKHAGTTDGKLARRMEAMCAELAEQREWKLLEAVTGAPREDGTRGPSILALDDLYEAWAWRQTGALERLRERLNDVDVEPYVSEWLKAVRVKLPSHSDTPERYRVHVRTLMPEGKPFPRSALTYRRIMEWLAGQKVSAPTQRKYRAALSSFCDYLVRLEVLAANPVAHVEAPKAGPPRQRYLDLPDIIRLVEAQSEPFRTLSALMHGTGMEISAALRVKRSDVDVAERKVRAHGTKTHARDRIVRVAEWAWPYVERHIKHLTPAAPLFPGIDRWRASDVHRAACKALGADFADYRMHDARHSYAVRAIRTGASLEFVARQLGHADTQMVVRVYGRYRPSEDEQTKWERIAAAQDAERAKSREASA